MADGVFDVSGVQAGVDAMTQVARAQGRIVMVAIHVSEAKTVFDTIDNNPSGMKYLLDCQVGELN